MELTLTKIGNSQGIIIPKTLIAQFGFREQIHVEINDSGILLTPPKKEKHPREGWAEDIQKAIDTFGPEILEPEDPEWLEIWEDDLIDWTWDEK